jgi:hypothetical protein
MLYQGKMILALSQMIPQSYQIEREEQPEAGAVSFA